MRVADKVAEWLEQKDIRHSFGIIGGGNCALFDAIYKRKFTELVCVHNEQAAAMAAIYYYRTSGKLAVTLVTTGAGSSNALTGVIAAWMDAIPLLVISGNEASTAMSAKTRILGVQGYRSALIANPICVMSISVNAPENTIPTLNLCHKRALAVFLRSGPAWIDIPKDIANAQLG